MKQGFYKSARNTAIALIESNGNDGVAPRHETEAQVCFLRSLELFFR